MENVLKINKNEILKGDKVLWMAVIFISAFSVFPVYSASSNLEYIVNNGTTSGHVMKHILFVIGGLALMRGVQAFKFEVIGKLSAFILGFMAILLGFTMVSGQQIDGASASRWITIPGTSLSFQPSAFAFLALIVYLCRYLTKKIQRKRLVWENILYIFVPILGIFLLVAKDILMVSIITLIIGQLNWRYILGFVSVAAFAIVLFLTIALSTDWIKSNRVHTWMSRIETFTSSKSKNNIEDEAEKAKNYQVMQAKAAIVHGGITGMGPGKSALKQMLPQSASDFIFAIVVEEYGLIGAFGLIALYMIIIFRIVIIATKMPVFFGSLLVISIGIMIFVQLAVNIAVAVNLIPVTGQPLPLISYGGTSILLSYIQLGLVLNVSSRIQVYDEEGIGKKQSVDEINDIA
jgi:cell division protein FtsW